MNNEEKILGLLGQVLERMDKSDAVMAEMRKEQAEIRKEQAEIRKEQAGIREMQVEMRKEQERMSKEQEEMHEEQVRLRADMMQMRREMNTRFDRLTNELKYAWQDIAHNERLLRQHEREYHNAG